MLSACVRIFIKKIIILNALLFLNSGLAYSMTPSHAFQRAEHLGQLVEDLLESDLYEKRLAPDPAKNPSLPRHVIRYAIRIFEEVQFLRDLNGLLVYPLPKIDATEVKPDDVIKILDATITSLQGLEDIYQTKMDTSLPALVEGKKPDDVLSRLRAIEASLYKLGVPKILPNDVYRVVLSIKQQTDILISQQGITKIQDAKMVDKASPADALSESKLLFADLKKVVSSDVAFQLPGGIARPPTPKEGEQVLPSDVFLVAQYMLADIYALNVKLGYEKPLQLPPLQSGKNPADVKNTLAQARMNIQSLYQNRQDR